MGFGADQRDKILKGPVTPGSRARADSHLRASPDLIYINDKSSEIIIVEIKYSRLLITRNLWPNIWAQLWCYSQIPMVDEAQTVTVIGEVWGELEGTGPLPEGRRRGYADGQSPLCLRASVRRDPRSPAYDNFFRQLFKIYCGER